MVEILEQSEAIGLREVRVRFLLRERSGHFDRDLLIADRRLDERMVGAEQPVDHRCLMMLDPPHLRQRHAQLAIHSCGRMLEAQRLHLDAVHENDADTREGVVVQLADRLSRQLAPSEALLVERRAAIFEQCQGHGNLRDFRSDSRHRRRPLPAACARRCHP